MKERRMGGREGRARRDRGFHKCSLSSYLTEKETFLTEKETSSRQYSEVWEFWFKHQLGTLFYYL